MEYIEISKPISLSRIEINIKIKIIQVIKRELFFFLLRTLTSQDLDLENDESLDIMMEFECKQVFMYGVRKFINLMKNSS